MYVLFTRCDRLPFFTDYVRGLTNDEAGQVLGITLPMHNVQAGVYAEEETRRLVASFDSLFYSLADKRLHFLPRSPIRRRSPAHTSFLASSASFAMPSCSSWWMSAVPASCGRVRFFVVFISPAFGR